MGALKIAMVLLIRIMMFGMFEIELYILLKIVWCAKQLYIGCFIVVPAVYRSDTVNSVSQVGCAADRLKYTSNARFAV